MTAHADPESVGQWFDELAEAHERFADEGRRRPIDRWVDERVRRVARAGGEAIVLGGGSGRACEPLLSAGMSVVLVDVSSRMAQRARRRLAPYEAAVVVRADAECFLRAETRTFDVMLATGEILAYVEDAAAMLRLCADVVRPQGDLVLTTMDRAVMCARLAVDDVLADDGGTLRFAERRGPRARAPLEARAFASDLLDAMLERSGFREIARCAAVESARVGHHLVRA